MWMQYRPLESGYAWKSTGPPEASHREDAVDFVAVDQVDVASGKDLLSAPGREIRKEESES